MTTYVVIAAIAAGVIVNAIVAQCILWGILDELRDGK